MNQVVLCIAIAATGCLAAVFDAELSWPYSRHALDKVSKPKKMVLEFSTLKPSSRASNIFSCEPTLHFHPDKMMTPVEFAKVIEDCWNVHNHPVEVLDTEQIKRFTKDQLLTLLYRHDVFYEGTIKAKYDYSRKRNSSVFSLVMPPVTPVELKCYQWHKNELKMQYEKKKNIYDAHRRYLAKIGKNVEGFPRMKHSDKIDGVAGLEAEIARIEQALEKLSKALAKAHVDLSFMLRDMFLYQDEVDVVLFEPHLAALPKIPNQILPLDQFLAIKAAVSQQQQ